MALVVSLRSDKTFKLFSYIIALYAMIICASFIMVYLPASATFGVSNILQIAGYVLHILSYASVLAVVNYLGRKKLFLFLAFQLICSLLIVAGVVLASTPVHFKILSVINLVCGILYTGTIFSIRKTPFNYMFTWLAVAEAILILIYSTPIFLPRITKVFFLTNLLPLVFLFLLVQKTRQHLAKAELEATFLDESKIL